MRKKFTKHNSFKNRFYTIFSNPFFWILTIVGNAIMLSGGLLLMKIESAVQSNPLQYIDYLLWSAGLITTIGYGDYMAVTVLGKYVVLALMLIGTLFIWSYMAFLVTGLFAPELASLEKEVHEFEKEVLDLKKIAISDKP